MPAETIFSKIIRRELPSDIVYQDEQVTAFRDINPQAPVHILIVPNQLIPTANDVLPEDEQLIGHMFVVARTIAAQEGIAENGYRLLVNCNRDGGQECLHLHIHRVGGRRLCLVRAGARVLMALLCVPGALRSCLAHDGLMASRRPSADRDNS